MGIGGGRGRGRVSCGRLRCLRCVFRFPLRPFRLPSLILRLRTHACAQKQRLSTHVYPSLPTLHATLALAMHHTLVLKHVLGSKLFDAVNLDVQHACMLCCIWMEQVEVVRCTHARGVVHRDLKLKSRPYCLSAFLSLLICSFSPSFSPSLLLSSLPLSRSNYSTDTHMRHRHLPHCKPAPLTPAAAPAHGRGAREALGLWAHYSPDRIVCHVTR